MGVAKRVRKAVGRACELVLGIVYPARCPFCGRWTDEGELMCSDCAKGMPKTPCVRHIPLEGEESLLVMSPLRYEGVFREGIISYKFKQNTWLYRPIGRIMIEILPRYPVSFDAIVYSPTSRRNVIKRGCDQSNLLAKELGRKARLPVIPALRRRRRVKTQHELSQKEREENVAGAFHCVEDVKGMNILLVDDIITTGNTIGASAKALYEAGAKKVYGICAADAGGRAKRRG